jgi:hypothetical protein
MSGRAAIVTQADVARVVRALKGETTGRVRVVIEGRRVIVEEAPEDHRYRKVEEDHDEGEVIIL